MLKKLSKSIYHYARSNSYYDIIEVLSELQIQLSLFEINLFNNAKNNDDDNNSSLLTILIQPISLLINLRSPRFYDYFIDNSIMNIIINAILGIYLITPLLILLCLIKTKYTIVPNFAYSWVSYLEYMHLYIISYIIHGWLIYQMNKLISYKKIIDSILIGFGLIFIIINAFITIFICKTCISQVYFSGFIGHKYTYNRWMNLIFKLIFPISQVFQSSSPSIKTTTVFILIIIWGILRQYYLIFTNPYYSYSTMKIMSCMQGITFGILLSNSIIYILQINNKNISNIVGIILFFISSFSGKFFMRICIKKFNELLYKMKNLNDIDYAAQYFIIEIYTDNYHKKEFTMKNIEKDELISNALLINHQIECNECHNEKSFEFIRNHLLVTKIFEGLNIHKNSFVLSCLAINFYLNQKNNVYLSCFLLEKLKKTILSIQDKLILKAYQIKIEEELYSANNESHIDYGRFADYEKFLEIYLCTIKNATETYLKFWSEINSLMPTLLNLIKFGIQIGLDHKKFKKKFATYESLFINEFAKPLLLAGLYYDILKSNHDKSFFMLQKYTKFMLTNFDSDLTDKTAKDTFYSKHNVNIRISGSDDSLGKIISCSGNITELTNLTAGKLIGRNITYILPNFFAAYHNDFIREYKETGISNIINKTNIQFCRHEDGYLIPVESNVLIYPMLDYGLIFLGIMRIIKTNREYMLINQDGEIEGMTLGISKDLNFKANHNKINFCSLVYFNKHRLFKEVNFERNINLQSLVISQIDQISSRYLNDNKSTFNSTYLKNGSQQSTSLFQHFIDDFSRDYIENQKKVIFKRIFKPNNNYYHHQTISNHNNMIQDEYLEYIVSLEKNCYKFGLQLYKLKLNKCPNIKNKIDFKASSPKKQLMPINYANIPKSYDESIYSFPTNQAFTKKPEFSRELLNDSNYNKSKVLSKQKLDSLNRSQLGDKQSLLSLNAIMPKLNLASELNLNFQREGIIRHETIILHPNIQEEENIIGKGSINSRQEFHIDSNKDDSYSLKSIYFIKNAKMKSLIHEKETNNIQRQLFKFHSIFLEMNTLFMIILFICSIVSIFIIYNIDIINISKINQDLMISYHCNQRLSNLVEIDRRLRSLWLIKADLLSNERHITINIPNYSEYCVDKAYEASQYLIGNNSLILQEIQYIDIISQNAFYSQLIRLYNVDKYGQRLLTNYTETNSFIAGYRIYEVMNNINKVLIQDITINTIDLLFMLRNNLNDIYREYGRSSHILINEIANMTNNIEQCNFIILIIILIISIICMALLIPGLSALFYKKNNLLMQIVNVKVQYCQFHMYRINRFFKALQENYSDEEFINLYDEGKAIYNRNNNINEFKKSNINQHNKKPSTHQKKMVNTFGIKLDLAKFFFILLVISIIYIVIFYIKKAIVDTYMDNIKLVIQRILFSSEMLAQQSFAMTLVYEYLGENGTTIVENNPIESAIRQTMPIIADLEGFLINFRNQKGDLDQYLQFIMVGNVCKIVPPDYTNDCISLGGGPGQNGISSINSYVYKALSTALIMFESSNRTINDINNTLSLSYLRDLEPLFYRITMPAYSYLYNQLLEELDNQIKSYKTFTLIWTLVTLICLLIIEFTIWLPINHRLINEIISMKRIMKIIPKSIIEMSKFQTSDGFVIFIISSIKLNYPIITHKYYEYLIDYFIFIFLS